MKRVLQSVVAGSALAIAPLACATVVVPAVGHADTNTKCNEAAVVPPAPAEQCADQQSKPQAQTLSCPDGTIVDTKYGKCVSLTDGIGEQLRALPPPPALSGFGGGDGLGGLGGLSGGIPSLGTINAPDLVLPSLGLGLVPNLNVNLQPSLPNVGAFNPMNPLGLPPM